MKFQFRYWKLQLLPTNSWEQRIDFYCKKIKNKILYLDKERAFDPERDREDADLERDLERRDDFPFGDLLQVD